MILRVLGALGGGIIGMFPTLPDGVQSVNQNVTGPVASFMATAADLGVWIPWGAIIPGFLLIVAVWVVTTVITVIRRILSHVTGGGGAIS